MTRLRFLLVAATAALLATGCQSAPPASPATSAHPVTDGPAEVPVATRPTGAPAADNPAVAPAASRPADAPAPTQSAHAAPASPYRVIYGWAVPAQPVQVRHRVAVPVAPPPAIPLPLLIEVRAADHPEGNYTRITFAFRGGTPSYEVGYARSVPTEGTGNPLPLAGNAFIRIQFTPAQAHDEHGRPTVALAAPTRLTFPTLRSYGFGGDFEGYVTFGLGLQVAANSDQVLPVRIGELVRSDGSHVVAVDVRRR
jgi:hypothetical protein